MDATAASTLFDWRVAVASDPRYVAQDQVPSRLSEGMPGEAWKERILAAFLKDDQLKETARTAQTRVGLLPAVVGGLAFLGKAIFGMKVGGNEVPVRDLALGPHEAALVLRDGRVLGTYSEARLQQGAGFVAWLKGLVGATPNYAILLADASPFELRLPFARDGGPRTLNTKDGTVLAGALTLILQLDVEHLDRVLGLFRGRTMLLADDVERRVTDLVFARVLVPIVREHLASDIRHNVALQDKIRGEAVKAIEESFRDLGILVRGAHAAFSMTDDERAEVRERRRATIVRLHEGQAAARLRVLEADHRLAVAEEDLRLNRERVVELQKVEHDLQVQGLKTKGDADREAAELASRRRRAEVDLELERLQTEQALLLRERKDALERRHIEDLRRIEREDALAREIQSRESAVAADIARAAAHRDLTPEQILAMKDADAAARVLVERNRADAARTAGAAEKAVEMAERQARAAHEMAMAHGAQIADVAKAAAGGARPQPTAVKAACPKCGREVEVGWRGCPHCGQPITTA